MENAFRRKVEHTIAQLLVARIKEQETFEDAAEDLDRLRQFVIVNTALKPQLRKALAYLKDAEFMGEQPAAEFEKEWKSLGGRPDAITDPLPTDGQAVLPPHIDPQIAGGTFTQLLTQPSELYGAAPQTPWRAVAGDELEGFLEQITPVDGIHELNPATTQVAWTQLSFYDSVALIRLVDRTWETHGMALYYLTDQGNLFRLNGTSPPIHEMNAKAPVKLNEQNVLDYLRFFCFFVRGGEGPFYVAEDLNSSYMPKMPDDTVRTVFEGSLRQATLEGTNDKGHFVCNAILFHSNAIFEATFAVQPTGMIEMLDDEPIAADLPIRVAAPLS